MPPEDDRRAAARPWHEKATADLAAARACIQYGGVPAWIVGFHLQQACEKSLKGLLVLAGREAPRTHDLARLHALLLEAGSRHPLTAEQLQALQPFATEERYPLLAPAEVSLDAVRGLVGAAEAAVRALADVFGKGKAVADRT